MSILLVGNSDGIGLAATRLLLARGVKTVGISRSASPIEDAAYEHHIADVTTPAYAACLDELLATHGGFDTCIYLAGIGHGFDVDQLAGDCEVFDVNLMAVLRTVEKLIPAMKQRGDGHFIALSSLADQLVIKDAVSYSASKAGLSSYLKGLRLALRPHGIAVTNVRFGFVDTKMADAPVKPMMISTEKAAHKLLQTMEKRPGQLAYPRTVAAAAWLLGKVAKPIQR